MTVTDIDSEKALKGLYGMTDLYKDILDIVIKDGRDKIDTIIEFFDNGDIERFAVEVHGLKSSMASCGAMEFSALCKKLELLSKANEKDQVASEIEDLRNAYYGVYDNIKSLHESM